MRDDEHRSRRPTTRVRTVALLATIVLLALFPLSGHAVGATTWTRNLFVYKAFVYQDPYYTACTAASVMHMLNTIAYRGTGGYGFRWTPYTVKKSSDPDQIRDMTSILAFERRRDTLRSTSAGSDAHGWRNALNYYGWGTSAMTDASLRPYEDRAYTSYGGAMKAAVRAIARLGMPVGVLAWAGGHAQVITGYVVSGADPRVSSDFTIQWIYLSDPLKSDQIMNRKTSYSSMKDGALKLRFQWYRETDSPYDDPYTAGWIRSSVSSSVGPSEWFHKWVLILPVRKGLPPPPPPEPTPTPTPTPEVAPAAVATATPSASPSASMSDSPSPSSSAAPVGSPADTPTPVPSGSPTAAPPTEAPSVVPTPSPTDPPTPAPTAPPTASPRVTQPPPSPSPSPSPTAPAGSAAPVAP